MISLLSRRDLVIAPLHVSEEGCRVSADVDGKSVFFSSDGARLVNAAESLPGAFLLPAMKARRALVAKDSVEAPWLANVSKIAETFSRWWRYTPQAPKIATHAPCSVPANATAACFTGGVDSFYTQLRGRHSIDALLYVHGFDIPLADTERAARFEHMFRRVAAALGKRPILLRTNLRMHPAFAAVSWEQTHGAALAAAGHLLTGTIGALVIPSSYTREHPQEWGSHWETDSLWSTSRLTVVHDDPILHRRAKLRAIAQEPILRDNLHVCWENLSSELNCSRCEKCLRTMIILAGCGVLDRFTVFDHSLPLPQRIDAVPRVAPHLLYVYDALAADPLPVPVAAAVQRLVARTKAKKPFISRMLKR